jgi:hypothetical protein
LGPQDLKRKVDPPLIIRGYTIDSCALDRSPRGPIRHEEDLGNKRDYGARTGEPQVVLRRIRGGVRPEDLIAHFHWYVAPERIVGLKADTSRPEVVARDLITADSRDLKVLLRLVERPVASSYLSYHEILPEPNQSLTRRSRTWRSCCRHRVSSCTSVPCKDSRRRWFRRIDGNLQCS